jgi:hypothetical protein
MEIEETQLEYIDDSVDNRYVPVVIRIHGKRVLYRDFPLRLQPKLFVLRPLLLLLLDRPRFLFVILAVVSLVQCHLQTYTSLAIHGPNTPRCRVSVGEVRAMKDESTYRVHPHKVTTHDGGRRAPPTVGLDDGHTTFGLVAKVLPPTGCSLLLGTSRARGQTCATVR